MSDQALPHVCSGCGAERGPSGEWTPFAERPTGPVSHGMCPECVEKYRAENEQLRRVAQAHTRKAGGVPTGGFRI